LGFHWVLTTFSQALSSGWERPTKLIEYDSGDNPMETFILDDFPQVWSAVFVYLRNYIVTPSIIANDPEIQRVVTHSYCGTRGTLP
jgi:hypothetical protein